MYSGRQLEQRLMMTTAQFVRVPFATQSTIILPPGTEHELDYVLLSDIFPTAWTCLEFSGFQAGDTVAVFGAGRRPIAIVGSPD